MRLIKVDELGAYSITSDLGSADIPAYAILSHTWGPDDQELTYQDIVDGTGRSKDGFKKLEFCIKQAKEDALGYFWIDTCCIDKTSLPELSEAINSMYKWYAAAEICYVLLPEVIDPAPAHLLAQPFAKSRWFTRGWTLQELIAPATTRFYDARGFYLGTKLGLEGIICSSSGLPSAAVRGTWLARYSVAERLNWAALRVTKKEEDMVYCMLGIFDVSMPLIYGEGVAHAFNRLKDAIAAQNNRTSPTGLLSDNLSSQRFQASIIQMNRLARLADNRKGKSDWVFKTSQYREWHACSSSALLLVSGDAGSGRTTLAAAIHEALSRQQQVNHHSRHYHKNEGTIIYHFFDGSLHEHSNGPLEALLAIVWQLKKSVPEAASVFSRRHAALSRRGAFEWTWLVLASITTEMLDAALQKGTVFLLIDGLDECDPRSAPYLRQWLAHYCDDDNRVHIDRHGGARLKVLLTGSAAALDSLRVVKSMRFELDLRRAEYPDRFLQVKLNAGRTIKEAAKHDNDRPQELNFQWWRQALRMQKLAPVGDGETSYTESWGLDTLYDATVTALLTTRASETIEVLRWLMYATEVFSERVLLEAIQAGDQAVTSTGISGAITAMIYHGFVASDQGMEQGSSIVHQAHTGATRLRFSHPSVREYLLRAAHDTQWGPREIHRLTQGKSHEAIALACTSYMKRIRTFKDLQHIVSISVAAEKSKRACQDMLDQHIFLSYAVQHWAYHRNQIIRPCPALDEQIWSLLDPHMCRMLLILKHFCKYGEIWTVGFYATPLHLLAYMDLAVLIKPCIERYDIDVNVASEEFGDTPLHWAAELGSVKAAAALLEAGVDPNRYEQDGWSALHWACRKGNLGMVELLVDNGADVKHADAESRIPLDEAIEQEHWDVVDFLVDVKRRVGRSQGLGEEI